MIFLADENISTRLSRILDIFDTKYEYRSLTDYFEAGTKDVVWIREVAEWDPNPIILSGDERILRNKVERKVLKDSNLSCVFLSGSLLNLSWNDLVWKMLKVWPNVVRDVSKVRNPTVFVIKGRDLKVELIHATAKL